MSLFCQHFSVFFCSVAQLILPCHRAGKGSFYACCPPGKQPEYYLWRRTLPTTCQASQGYSAFTSQQHFCRTGQATTSTDKSEVRKDNPLFLMKLLEPVSWTRTLSVQASTSALNCTGRKRFLPIHAAVDVCAQIKQQHRDGAMNCGTCRLKGNLGGKKKRSKNLSFWILLLRSDQDEMHPYSLEHIFKILTEDLDIIILQTQATKTQCRSQTESVRAGI